MLKRYYENTSTYKCVECKHIWKLTVWQWLFRIMKIDFTRHSYVKCPRCGVRHWLKAEMGVE